MPGEFRDVDVPGGAIKDNITFLPYKEPSGVLHALLGEIVEEGRRFASITDLKLADMKQDAPVGTTLALIERSMKVMSAIQARLHDAMRKELILIAGIVRDYAEDEYEYEPDDKEAIKGDDFDGRVDIIPVSDPNAATMSQRIMQYQAALQLSQSAPQMYDLPELHRQMLDVLGIQDAEKIIPLSEEMKPRDPVSENMDVLNSKPLKAFISQDHEAHIQVHMAAIQDPKIQELVSQSPMAGTIAAAMSAHIQEHLGFQYRREIEQQLGLPRRLRGCSTRMFPRPSRSGRRSRHRTQCSSCKRKSLSFVLPTFREKRRPTRQGSCSTLRRRVLLRSLNVRRWIRVLTLKASSWALR